MLEHPEPRTHQQNRDQRSYRRVPVLEWIASVLGFLLLTASIAAILYYTSEQDTPPKLRTEAGRVSSVANGYLVEVTVHNDGGSTAAAVNVVGSLTRSGEALETASTTFDYVPAHSQSTGGMFFSHDPRMHRMQLEANAYMDP